MFKKFLTVAVLCLFIIGCKGLFGNKPPAEEEVVRTPIKGALLAQVNDWSIGTVDFNEKLEALVQLLPDDPTVRNQLNDKETKKKILQELVNFEILAQEAEGRGLDKEPDVIDAVKNFKRNFLAQKMLGDIYKDITVTEMEVQQFYDTNKTLFRAPESRQVREIVVAAESDAKNILIRLLQGESFASLARTYSIAPSKDQGGDLGNLTIDDVTVNNQKFPAFWKAAVTTEEGKTSSYFKGPDGYYLIKVEKVQGGTVKALSEVKTDIQDYLKQGQVNKKKEDIIATAKQKMKVIISEDLLE